MTDTYVVKVERVTGNVATFRIASLNEVDFASTRSFAIRLLFDAARRRGESELRDLNKWQYETQDAAEQAARGDVVFMRRMEIGDSKKSAIAADFGDKDGPYEETWFRAHAQTYVSFTAVSERTNEALSNRELRTRLTSVEERTTQADPMPQNAMQRCEQGWLESLHSYVLSVTCTQDAWVSHLREGEVFRTSACDLCLEADAPHF